MLKGMKKLPLQIISVLLVTLFLTQSMVLGGPIDFSKYHKYNVIEEFFLYLAMKYDIIRLSIIGYSWRNRPLYALFIGDVERKPIVFIVGLHHGRELVSAQFPIYFTYLLLTNDSYRRLLDHYAFIIVPILNPDGYEEAFRNPWQRKNCRPVDDDGDGLIDEDPPEDLDGDGRIARYYNVTHMWYEGIDNDSDGKLNEDWIGGVDLNRNYPFMWEKGSKAKRSLIYRGPEPLSEPETKALDLLIRHYANKIVLAISYHSGVDLVLYPWSYKRESPPDGKLFREVGWVYTNITHSKLMQSSSLYLSFGEFMDYLYHDFHIITFTVEIYGWAMSPEWFKRHMIKINKTRIFKYIFEAFNPSPGRELLKVLKLHAIALKTTLTYYKKYALILYREKARDLRPDPMTMMIIVLIATGLVIVTGYKGASKPK